MATAFPLIPPLSKSMTFSRARFFSRVATVAILTAAALTALTAGPSEQALERACRNYAPSPAACLRF
jgi:hypothetical protein